jgi:chorismate mutase
MSTPSENRIRALRGATTCGGNDPQAITEATTELLVALLERNQLTAADLVSIVFTATPDLTAEFPAVAARNLGLFEVPLLCAQEMAVPGAPPACIRVLIHHYGGAAASPVYLRGAESLRHDLKP